MDKTIFLNVSPKAVKGIRRVYEAAGAVVKAILASDGKATVIVLHEGELGTSRKPAEDIAA